MPPLFLKTCCARLTGWLPRRIARAVVENGDASQTDFVVVDSNEAATLDGFTAGLVATEAMYMTRYHTYRHVWC
jgi:hypothetical protein